MTATPVIAVGISSLTAINKFDSAGNYYQHGHKPTLPYNFQAIYGIDLDVVGNVYAGGICYTYSDTELAALQASQPSRDYGDYAYNIFSLNQDGYLRWTANHKAIVWNVVVDDSSGNVFVAGQAVNSSGSLFSDSIYEGGGPTGDRTGYYTTRAYSSAGNLLWSADHGFCFKDTPLAIAHRGSYLYTGGDNTNTTGNLTKYNAATGTVIWSVGNTVIYGIAVDSSDNVYTTGLFRSGDNRYWIHKYNSSGTLIASAATIPSNNGDKNITAYGIAIDSGGDIIISSYGYEQTLGGGYKRLHKYDSDLIYIHSNGGDMQTHNAGARSLKLDADDNVYFCTSDSNGVVSQLQGVWKVPADFSTFTDFDDYLFAVYIQNAANDTEEAWCLAVKQVEQPALKIPLDLGLPSWIGDIYTSAPALAIALQLATPSLFRDYVGVPQPKIYRCYLTGGTGTIELVISSLSIRRTSTTVSLTVVIPGFSESSLTQIEARTAGNLIIKSGIRFADGTEQLDELITVAFTEFSWDGGANSQSITLTGLGDFTATNQTTRAITGISYRNSRTGTRRIRGDIDTYLRAGDIADLGNSESMTVDEITITINQNQAVMEISEA